MTQPARVERVWLVLARATLLTLSVGEEAQEAQEAQETASPVRAFRRGQFRILACLVTGRQAVGGDFIPQPWEKPPHETRGNTPRQTQQAPLAREYLPQ